MNRTAAIPRTAAPQIPIIAQIQISEIPAPPGPHVFVANRHFLRCIRRGKVAMRKTPHELPPGKARFTLWREVLVAYVAPTLLAGVGGLISGQASLLVSSFTSIGISSAVVATLTGAWLQRRGLRHPWLKSGPRLVAIARIAVTTALLGGLAGWLVNLGASLWFGAHQWPWPDDLGINLPVSATIAAMIITWRWRGAQQTPTSLDTPDT
ncbi:hypothetical protein ACIBHX_13460 [Nonomuraea sp. NPDC050536]|uniref:hypothetical protein n=1 Tax=Nonomuraea sp. NPDC050536 TaxID=3364366 RepID=UPI0037C5F941